MTDWGPLREAAVAAAAQQAGADIVIACSSTRGSQS